MKKILLIIVLALVIIFSLKTYYSAKNFYKYYSGFSAETKQWVTWYMSLSEEDRLCVNSWPFELQNAIDDGFDFSRYIPKDK